MFALFDGVTKLFEEDPKTWAAMMYVRTPLLIPLASTAVASLLKHTGSRDEFAAEIDRRIDMYEAYVNGEF